MHCWKLTYLGEETAAAVGSAAESECALARAFLHWLDLRDLQDFADSPQLAGFLAAESDLTRREITGLLNTFEFEAYTGEPFSFAYDGEIIDVTQHPHPASTT